jgi:hypothetical protein
VEVTGADLAAAAEPRSAGVTRHARWARRHAQGIYRVEKGVHVVTAAAALYLLVAGTMAMWNMNVAQCDRIQPDSLRGWILAAAAIGGALLGRFVARLWYEARLELNRGSRRVPLVAPAWLHAGLFVFLVLSTALLGYETWSVLNFYFPPPITWYVRCSAYYHPIVAPLAAGGIGFLLTSWFWYPTR